MQFIVVCVGLLMGLSSGFCSINIVSSHAPLKPKQALYQLQQGNERYVKGQARNNDYASTMKNNSNKRQAPVAIVLSCIDSLSVPDVLFDQGLGNLLVSRVAGNVVNADMLGSMEYATKYAGASLVVIMGHTQCGAVKGACVRDGHTGMKNLDALFATIQPAAHQVKASNKTFSCRKNNTIDEITKQNVVNQMKATLYKSQTLSRLVKNNQVGLLGAIHDVASGKVVFFDLEGKVI